LQKRHCDHYFELNNYVQLIVIHYINKLVYFNNILLPKWWYSYPVG
jgi:hypothetical protein